MCRLTAYLGKPVAASALVFGGTHPLFRQSWAPRELLSGSVNADGYGVVWYAGGGTPEEGAAAAERAGAAAGPDETHARPARIAEARPIWQDEEELRTTLGVIRSPCVVAALRNGTPGIPIDRSGLLPLTHDGWTFVLNGFIPDFRVRHMRALRASLPDRLYGALRGSSDSETVFFLVLAALEQGATPIDALRITTAAVAERVASTEAQLAMLLTDGVELVAARTGTAARTNSMYMASGHPLADQGVLLASETLDAHGSWAPIGHHEAVVIGRDGEVSKASIGA